MYNNGSYINNNTHNLNNYDGSFFYIVCITENDIYKEGAAGILSKRAVELASLQ